MNRLLHRKETESKAPLLTLLICARLPTLSVFPLSRLPPNTVSVCVLERECSHMCRYMRVHRHWRSDDSLCCHFSGIVRLLFCTGALAGLALTDLALLRAPPLHWDYKQALPLCQAFCLLLF